MVERTVEELTTHIYGLCNRKTNFVLQNEFFAQWYIKAFPDKLEHYLKHGWFDDTYCEEWISRFMKGTPTIHMDGERLRAYFDVAINWNSSAIRIV